MQAHQATAAAFVARPSTRRRRERAQAVGWESGGVDFRPPEIHISYDDSAAEELVYKFISDASVVGYDTEWRPVGFGGDGRTALIQLATPTACVLLPVIHLASHPASLKRLLSSPATFLCGVNVAEDVAGSGRAQQRSGATPVDVGLAAARAGLLPPSVKGRIGLAALVSLLGGPALSKKSSVTLSDWSKRELSDAQRTYAALDAYAGGWCAARVHAAVRSKSRGALPLPAWLAGEGAAQRADADAAAARSAAACAAVLAAAGAHPKGLTSAKLARVAAASLGENETYVRNRVTKLLTRGKLAGNGDVLVLAASKAAR